MNTLTPITDRKQAGFTLVELAVVMIIIGLLIGGVLKGQELIANAQIAATASAVKGIDAATTTFRDTFAAMPGDMRNANTRLSNCTATPCFTPVTASYGNGRVDSVKILVAPANENLSFFPQLAAADLISGVSAVTGAAGNAWGANFPEAPIGGGFHAAYHAGGALGVVPAAPGARPGHYLLLNNNPGAAPRGSTAPLSALEAARLDRKLDDGNSRTGTVFPLESACNVASLYPESNTGVSCHLIIRFQN